MQKLVAEFHLAFGHPALPSVSLVNLTNKDLVSLRLKLLREEIQEGIDAEAILANPEADASEKSNAVIELFDSLIDTVVVTLGTGLVFGLQLDTHNCSAPFNEGDDYCAPLLIYVDRLEQTLADLALYPKTKSYLAATVSRTLQDMVDWCIAVSNYLGFPFREGFLEVHRSNMSKLGLDGKPIYREDGKILKGANYFKPNLKALFDEETL